MHDREDGFPSIVVDGQVVPLDRARITIGKDPGNDIVISDSTVSRSHAVIEAVGNVHTIVDLGSRNGTTVNGERVFSHRTLHPSDEIRLGRARLIYSVARSEASETTPLAPPPALTPREKDVLVELCRPIMAGTLFTEPASSTHMARELFITEAAVRMHLSRLYHKFGIDEAAADRRALLATAAIERGAVTAADLRSS